MHGDVSVPLVSCTVVTSRNQHRPPEKLKEINQNFEKSQLLIGLIQICPNFCCQISKIIFHSLNCINACGRFSFNLQHMICTSNWRINRLIKLIPVLCSHIFILFPPSQVIVCYTNVLCSISSKEVSNHLITPSVKKKNINFIVQYVFHDAVIMMEIHSDNRGICKVSLWKCIHVLAAVPHT